MTTSESAAERDTRKRKLRAELDEIEAIEKTERDGAKAAQRQRDIEQNKTKHGRAFDFWYEQSEATIQRAIEDRQLALETLRGIRDVVYPKPKFQFGYIDKKTDAPTTSSSTTCSCGEGACERCAAKKLRFDTNDAAISITPPTNVRAFPFEPRGGQQVVHFATGRTGIVL